MSYESVRAAFETLLAELNLMIDSINKKSASAVNASKYDEAGTLIEKAKDISMIREKIDIEYQRFRKDSWPVDDVSKLKRYPKRVQTSRVRNPRAPQKLYKIPLLEALTQLGGKGTPREVEEIVYPVLKPYLTTYDHTPLKTFGNRPRWTHRLAWTRWELANDGLISREAPRGIWQITEAGRNWLKDQKALT